MKKMITICMLCCFCMIGYSQVTSPAPPTRPPMISGSKAIDCIQNNTSLVLCFNQSLGEITIAVWGKTKVYTKTISAFTGNILTIPTNDWNKTTYAVCITDSRGKVIASFTVPIN